MSVKHLIWASLIYLASASASFAAMPLATDDAGTLGSAKFQLETGLQFDWDRQDNTRTTGQSLDVTLTGGLLDSVDLVAAYSYLWQTEKRHGITTLDNSGFNDLSLTLKWRFLETGPLSLALKPAVTFPTASYDRGLGAGRPSYGATLVATVDLRPVAIHANLGYTYQKYTDAARDASRNNLFNISLATSVYVAPNLQLVAEVGGATNADSTSSVWPMFVTGGVIYSFTGRLDVDLGVRGGLTNAETDISLLTGTTVRF